MKKLENLNYKLKYIIAFVLPIVIGGGIILLYRWLGTSPIGMENDVNIEYVEFLSYFKQTIMEQGNFFYSFHKGFGGEMIAFFAYYFASPFHFISLLFSQENMPYALLTIVLLKIGFSGLSMNLFLDKVICNKWYTVVFSVSYALMGYTVAYCYNYMWMDGVLILPIVILGLHRIFEKKRISLLYIIALFYAVMSNYYIGWMICIFSSLYVLYLLIAQNNNWREKVNAFIQFFVSSLIAAGMSCVILIPTLRALMGSAKSSEGLRMDFNQNFEPFMIFTRFFSNAVIDKDAGLPNLFCGSLVFLIFIVLFFFGKQMKVREKFGALVVLLFCFLSMWIQFFNLIWHGFNYNIGYPYRYSFVVSFFVIALACKGFSSWKQSYRKNVIIGFAVLQLIDISIYAYSHMNTGVMAVEQYQADVAINEAAIQKLKEKDSGFYRIEKLYRRTPNDACQNNYYGLTHYSSSVSTDPIYFLEKLGLTRANSDYTIFYKKGITTFADSLLSVKYILTKDNYKKSQNPILKSGEIEVYQNLYALPFAYACSDKIMNVYGSNDYGNGLMMQNEWAKSMVVSDLDIYRETQFEVSYENLETDGEGAITVKKVDPSKDAYINYQITISDNDDLYATMFSWKRDGIELYVNGELVPEFTLEEFSTTLLGRFEVGDQIQVQLKVTADEFKLEQASFYYENRSDLDGWRKELEPYCAEITSITNSKIGGFISADAEHSKLVFAIPYDNRWRLKIDGNPVQIEKVFEGLVTANIPEGRHSFEMEYVPNGLKTGILISIFSSLCLLVIVAYRVKKGYGKNNEL